MTCHPRARCHVCRTITRPSSDAVLARAVPISAHKLYAVLDRGCQACDALIGEPCRPDCIGEAAYDDEQEMTP